MNDSNDQRPSLPDIARDAIGRRLRESLDRIVAEPIPDRFLKLLDDLEQSGPDSVEPADAPPPVNDAEDA
jgi:hypothetical protein